MLPGTEAAIFAGGGLLVTMGADKKGCCSRRVAFGRSFGTRLKQSSRKSLASGDRFSGMGGGSLLLAILKSADTCQAQLHSFKP